MKSIISRFASEYDGPPTYCYVLQSTDHYWTIKAFSIIMFWARQKNKALIFLKFRLLVLARCWFLVHLCKHLAKMSPNWTLDLLTFSNTAESKHDRKSSNRLSHSNEISWKWSVAWIDRRRQSVSWWSRVEIKRR